jgi:CBS domain-containing protein
MDLLISHNIGCLPVLDEGGKLVGIISDKDIFKKIHETKGDYHSLSVGDVMSTAVIVGLPDDDITYIAGLMGKNWIRHVPIIENEQLIGLVSQRDIIKTQAKKTEIENRYLKLYLEEMDGPSRSGDL